MISSLGVIGLIIVVYWCRNFIQKHLQGLAMLLGLSARSGLMLYTLIFFPGVFLHEMSHFLMAAVLGVKTGEITLFPRFNQEPKAGGAATLGSVEVAKSDFIRASFIGAAPFIAGSLALYFMVKTYFFDFKLINTAVHLTWTLNRQQPFITFIMLYLIFVIGNTMFSSKEDTRSWPLIVIIMVTLAVLGYLSGNLHGAIEFFKPFFFLLANTLLGAMFFAVIIDVIFIIFLIILEHLFQKILKKRVRYGL
jgi:hypothetical protein